MSTCLDDGVGLAWARIRDGKVVLTASYRKGDLADIRRLCTEAINARHVPAAKIMSGGLPELGKRH
jgi:hypothetical protein